MVWHPWVGKEGIGCEVGGVGEDLAGQLSVAILPEAYTLK